MRTSQTIFLFIKLNHSKCAIRSPSVKCSENCGLQRIYPQSRFRKIERAATTSSQHFDHPAAPFPPRQRAHATATATATARNRYHGRIISILGTAHQLILERDAPALVQDSTTAQLFQSFLLHRITSHPPPFNLELETKIQQPIRGKESVKHVHR